MNTVLLSAACHQISRALNISSKHIYKISPLIGQQTYFSTSTVHWFHPRVSSVSVSTHKKLRKQYGLSDDYYVMYKEPKPELNYMVYLKWFELILYGSPLMTMGYIHVQNQTIASFVGQENFYIGVFIICIYLLGVRFVANGFVKVMFYNPVTDVYRAYVLNKYKPTYKFVEFKSEDLKVINLSPSIPLARNFFRVGKQNLILHDQLFASYNDQEKLTGSALDEWQSRWGK